ncbi:MAG: hypothetical protein M1840_005085 [Geoglossum simile]|nr:MAG: hypothetical protein M1840_005085 [Geoglossum simile]
MASCPHIEWLQLCQDQEEWSMAYGARLQNIVEDMPHARAQYPSLLFFVGRKVKAKALRALFPENNHTRRRGHGLANLHIDSITSDTERPILFADADLEGVFVERGRAFGHCHETTRYRIDWANELDPRPNQKDLMNKIYAQLFFPFIDVLCLFAEDFGGLDEVTAQLTMWAKIGPASSMIRSRVIIVTTQMANCAYLIEDLSNLSKFFASVKVVNLREIAKVSSTARYLPLKGALLCEADTARQTRIGDRTMFSATHLRKFFERALRQIAKAPDDPFDFIWASREGNEVDSEFPFHLRTFLRLCLKYEVPLDSVVSFIASAILMDNFPPGMHRFNPRTVFQRLYRIPCREALLDGPDTQYPLPENLCQLIEDQVATILLRMELDNIPSSELRWHNLKAFGQGWAGLKMTTTCLFCLRRKPEHILHCGHAICDTCACIFGKQTPGIEYHFDVFACVLCQLEAKLTIKLKPPTAGTRLLMVDGGGIRGAVSLEFLDALEQAMGLPYSLQHHFDLALGTSSGGLIVLLLFLGGRSIKHCISTFDRLAKRIFVSRKRSRGSFCSLIPYLFTSWLADSRYDATVLQACLKETYGEDRRMFGVIEEPSGTKVAVTATTISDATLCIFSNYNGAGMRRKDCGYKHFRPHDEADEVMIHQAAQSTSAAPSIFPAIFIPALGYLQDGGVGWHNNPLDPALWESRLIWPSNAEPDLMVSVGTDFARAPSSPEVPRMKRGLKDGFIPRLFRSLMSVFNAEKNWVNHLNRLDEKARDNNFRLNIPLKKEPPLDEVNKMDELRQRVHLHLRTHDDTSGIVRALWSSSFFFELDEIPISQGGWYECRGSIRCRSPNSRAFVALLAQEFPSALFTTDHNITLGHMNEGDLCMECGLYRKAVKFYVYHPGQAITIFLRLNQLYCRKISGFSNSMSWFVQQQRLGADFGRPDHQSPEGPVHRKCNCLASNTARKKRVSLQLDTNGSHKRRRLN